jgi:hypothetical protein
MQKKIFIALIAIGGSFLCETAEGQILKKLKDKVNQAAGKTAGEKTGTNTGDNTGNSGNSSTSSNTTTSRPSNKGGAGLVSTPPDLAANMTSSEASFKENKYSESRFALQQAILGVELQIGKEILKSLPDSVSGLPKIAEKDKVASGGWGWSGLTISRDYQRDDKFLGVGIQDFSYLGPAWSMFLNGGMMNSQMENEKQKMKNIMVKGNKGVISYDDSKGYTVVVMLTQGSALVWEGVNFASEDEIMKAVNAFDIDRIKKFLGEK